MTSRAHAEFYRVSEQQTVQQHLAEARMMLRSLRRDAILGSRPGISSEIAELTRAVQYMRRWLVNLESNLSLRRVRQVKLNKA